MWVVASNIYNCSRQNISPQYMEISLYVTCIGCSRRDHHICLPENYMPVMISLICVIPKIVEHKICSHIFIWAHLDRHYNIISPLHSGFRAQRLLGVWEAEVRFPRFALLCLALGINELGNCHDWAARSQYKWSE